MSSVSRSVGIVLDISGSIGGSVSNSTLFTSALLSTLLPRDQ